MTSFRYRAAREDGERVTGLIEAPGPGAAAALLGDRGLIAFDVREARDAHAPHRHAAELAPLFGGLAALLESGLPTDRALAAIATTAVGAMSEPLQRAVARLREGATLSAALASIGGIPQSVLGMLRAGEAHGRVADAARRAAAELERRAELGAELRSALTYPAFLLSAGSISVVVIVGVVVPRFAALLGDLGQALPASTRLLLAVSSLVRSQALPLLVTLVVASLVLASLLRTTEVLAALHRYALGWPLIGSLRLSFATAGNCRTLAALLEAGVPVLPALDLTQSGCGDLEIARRLGDARRDVSEGSRLDAALRRHSVLTAGSIQLVRYGDETGRVAEFLGQAARLEDASTRRSVRSMMTMIEPMLIVLFGGLVAFVAAALLQAVYSVRPAGF